MADSPTMKGTKNPGKLNTSFWETAFKDNDNKSQQKETVKKKKSKMAAMWENKLETNKKQAESTSHKSKPKLKPKPKPKQTSTPKPPVNTIATKATINITNNNNKNNKISESMPKLTPKIISNLFESRIGSLCEIYSNSHHKWIKCEIINELSDIDNNDWFEVKYKDYGLSKTIRVANKRIKQVTVYKNVLWKYIESAVNHELYDKISDTFMKIVKQAKNVTVEEILVALKNKLKIDENEIRYVKKLIRRAIRFFYSFT
eukprot:292984_1